MRYEHVPVEVSISGRHADRLVVGVSGEIDRASAGEFLRAVLAARADGDRHLVLDMSGCEFCDSSGISALARLVQQTQAQGGEMLLAGSRSNLARTLAITGLDELVRNHGTVTDALAALPEAGAAPAAEPG